jgi:hypothetical protein
MTRRSAILLHLLLITGVRSAFSPSKNIRRAAKTLIDTTASVLSRNPNYSSRLQLLDGDSCANIAVPQQHDLLYSITPRTVLGATVYDAEETIASTATNNETFILPGIIDKQQDELIQQIEKQAEQIVDGMMDESCEVNSETGAPMDDICIDDEKKRGFRDNMKDTIQRIERLVVERDIVGDDDDNDKDMEKAASAAGRRKKGKKILTGDALEKGCKLRHLIVNG